MMRFSYGPVPPSRVLDPETEDWTPLTDLPANRLATIAVLIGLPFLVVGMLLLKSELRGLKSEPAVGFAFALAIVAMVPVHEVIHALAYGKGVRSPHLVLGVWPSRGMCYAIFDSPLPRERVLWMMAAPFLALTILPLLALPWVEGPMRRLTLTFALLHAGTCGGDAVVIWRLATQIPRNALVHNGGWRTYWKTSGCPSRVSSQPGG